MEENNNTVVNSSDNGNPQETEQNSSAGNGENGQPSQNATPTQPVQFSAEQQQKVNSLLKEEKSKFYGNYGVSKGEELDELVNAGREYNKNKENYSTMQQENLSLKGTLMLFFAKICNQGIMVGHLHLCIYIRFARFPVF